MSRSYRKPWVVDGWKGSKRKQFFKNYANRVARRTKDLPDGMAYRRVRDPWDICDYKWYDPKGFYDWAKMRRHKLATGEDVDFFRWWTTNRK